MTTPSAVWLTEEMHWGERRVRLSAGPADAASLARVWGKSAHAVVFTGRSVLLVREAGGDWHFPGGRTDPGETLEQALAREMMEEAGATLVSHPLLFAAVRVEFPDGPPPGADGDPHTVYYIAELAALTPEYAGDPALAEQQIAERCLVPLEDAAALLRPFDRRLLKEALAWRQRSPA